MTPFEMQLRTFATVRKVDQVPDYKSKKSIRVQIIEILKHRISSLKNTPDFQGKAKMIDIATKSRERFENIKTASEERVLEIVRDETPHLLYLYTENTSYKNVRNHLLTIISHAHNVQ